MVNHKVLNIDPDNITLYGSSLGGALSLYIADYSTKMNAKDKSLYRLPKSIALLNTFTSISGLLRQHDNWI